MDTNGYLRKRLSRENVIEKKLKLNHISYYLRRYIIFIFYVVSFEGKNLLFFPMTLASVSGKFSCPGRAVTAPAWSTATG